MRSAFATFIVAASAAVAASAQAPAAPPVAPVVAPAPAPAAAPVPAPAAPAAPAATPAPASAADIVIPEAAPAVPQKTYTIPTDGEIGQLISVINNICVPLVRGGDLDTLATPALGYKKNKRDLTYTATLVAKPYTLTIFAPGSNKEVCRIAINYTTGQEKPIIVGLNIFSLLHQPELEQQRNDYVPATDFKRITNSWEYFTDHESTGLVFLQLKKPDGSEVSDKWSMGEILYSERKF